MSRRQAPAPLSPSLVLVDKGKAAPATESVPEIEPEPERIGITTRLTLETHERLRRLAFDSREPKGRVIERAVVAFLDQHGV